LVALSFGGIHVGPVSPRRGLSFVLQRRVFPIIVSCEHLVVNLCVLQVLILGGFPTSVQLTLLLHLTSIIWTIRSLAYSQILQRLMLNCIELASLGLSRRHEFYIGRTASLFVELAWFPSCLPWILVFVRHTSEA